MTNDKWQIHKQLITNELQIQIIYFIYLKFLRGKGSQNWKLKIKN